MAASPVPNSNLWDQVRSELQSNLSKPTFETWIRPAVCVSAEQRRLVLEAPNPFAAGWLRRNYLGLIAEVASAISGGPVEVQIQAGDEASSEPVSRIEASPAPAPTPLPVSYCRSATPPQLLLSRQPTLPTARSLPPPPLLLLLRVLLRLPPPAPPLPLLQLRALSS